ncbi:MAG: bifunctional 4-hydroxy-3-methylbut-2-enyl diphosphate reductase/30S ribosomal protein S1 [Syntrophomonadaceae bacterium]|nr:bifunctional 4-hydroxy-3-methylbut-2-enyl diphosphate reductase/30S ribosomal protein S1 [Syntrophomonadaceae bacterium]
MDIIVAENAGFCSGVRRAFQITEALSRQETKWYSLGPLVHNQDVINYFVDRGIEVINNVDEVDSGGIIIRSHGVAPEIIAEAQRRGLEVRDATCPLVKRVQDIAQLLIGKEYAIIIYGDALHPEVQSIVGWCGGQATVAADVAAVQALEPLPRAALLAQTTKSTEVFEEMQAILAARTRDFRSENTICPASRIRQDEAERLSRQVDLMVVIGDPASSNSNSLVKICDRTGVKTLFVANAGELDPKDFKRVKRLGVTAGASTPDWIIKEVVERMSEIDEKLQMEQNEEQEVKEECCPDGCPEGCCQALAAEEVQAEQEPEVTAEPVEEPAVAPAEETGVADESFVRMEAEMADLASPARGDIVKGKIVEVADDSAMVDVGGKSEGIIPLRELSNQDVASARELVSVGDEIEVLVLKWDDDGTILLSKKKVDSRRMMDKLEESFNNGSVVEGTVISSVKGGLLVDVGVSAFLPASHVEDGYVKDLNDYVGRTLQFKIIEFNRNKKRGSQIVVSRKEIVENEKQLKREAFWGGIEEGQVLTGTVKRIVDYGAFIDLGGFEGLLHVSEMDHVRIDHPSSVLSEGDEIEVYILALDRDKQRVSLSRKKLLKSPWELVMEKYSEGDIIEGEVVRIAPFGAFVQIEAGVDGLVHISQLADRRVEKPEDVVSVHEVVKMKILSIDPESRRIGLSIRAAMENTEQDEVREYLEQQDEAEAAPAAEETQAPSEAEAELPAVEAETGPSGEAVEAPPAEDEAAPEEEEAEAGE